MKITLSLVVFMLISCNLFSENTFEDDAISIKTPTATKNAGQFLQMFLPATDGFAPNVNIQKQKYDGTINEYFLLSMNQFKQMKLKLINSNVTKTSTVMEYSGVLQGKNFHFYARAHKKGGLIYLATATSLESQWEKVSKELKEIIDSFKMKMDKKN